MEILQAIAIWSFYGFLIWLVCNMDNDTAQPNSRSAREIYLDTKKEGK